MATAKTIGTARLDFFLGFQETSREFPFKREDNALKELEKARQPNLIILHIQQV